MTAPSPESPARPALWRRRVFFIAGFDPRAAQGYYRRIGEAQRAYGEIGPLESWGPLSSGWRFHGPAEVAHGPAEVAHGPAEVAFEILDWSDIVDAHWQARGHFGAMVAAVRSLWVYARCGLLTRSRNGARAVWMALLVMGLTPPVMILAALAFASLVGVYGGWLALPALALGLVGGDLVWRKLNLEWLAKGFACLVETARGERPGWDARCAAFAERIAEVAREEHPHEIVVVGHSLGAVLAMMTARRYLEIAPNARLTLATLGNIVPFYTWVEPDGRWLRQGAVVAQSPEIDWIDITSGSDPASACRMGPLVGTNAAVRRWEPEFHNILTPERFRYIRRRPLDFHFQYLRPADRPGGFDFIKMICSAQFFFAGAPP